MITIRVPIHPPHFRPIIPILVRHPDKSRDKVISALIDTGSPVSFLDHQLIKGLTLPKLSDKSAAFYIGSNMEGQYSAKLVMNMQHTTGTYLFYQFDKGKDVVEAIIGTNLLKNFEINYSPKEGFYSMKLHTEHLGF